MLQKRGAVVELIEANEQRVQVRIRGGDPGRGTFAPAVEKVIRSAAPEAVSVSVEDTAVASTSGFVPLESLGNAASAGSATPIHK
jgi:hypothetical protein